jgi:hypothetical protein
MEVLHLPMHAQAHSAHTRPAPLVEEDPKNLPDPLPRFSHVPPKNVTGIRRWPFSLDAQSFPTTSKPALKDVLIWVHPFLERHDKKCTASTATAYRWGPAFGPLWFTRPWSPNRRRRWGFGVPHANRTVVNDTPAPHICIHFAWTFLTPMERVTMSRATEQWFLYQKLRVRAVTLPIAQLLQKRSPSSTPRTLPIDRAILYASALLRFHFYYGDFVRWLGGSIRIGTETGMTRLTQFSHCQHAQQPMMIPRLT